MQGYIEAVDKLVQALAGEHRFTQLVAAIDAARPEEATEAERAEAADDYGTDDVEVDDVAYVSRADDGCWVSAWVWVAYSDTGDDDEATL